MIRLKELDIHVSWEAIGKAMETLSVVCGAEA